MGALLTLCCKRRRHHDDQGEVQTDQTTKIEYSWDKRKKDLNVEDFIIKDKKNETLGRLPGTINGEQFMIQNCEDCSMYLFDHIATINIDDCVNCNLFIGPVKTSVFMRDCKNCRVVTSCQQFRVRDCSKTDIFLHCTTQPIIESSSGLRFGCYQFYYPELESQFREAGLSVYNNNWSNIHDFSQIPGEQNYSLMPQDVKVEDHFHLPSTETLAQIKVSTATKDSLVPLTLGARGTLCDESCLVVFFNDGRATERTVALVDEVKKKHSNLQLVSTLEVKMSPGDANRVFSTDAYNMAVETGPVIGLQFNGPGVVNMIQECVVQLITGATGLVYVSSSPSATSTTRFFEFTDIQMNV